MYTHTQKQPRYLALPAAIRKNASAALLKDTGKPVQKKAGTNGLPDNLKTSMESLSGYSLDDVKVHYNSDKPAQLQAHAYAQGTDIHVAPGREKHLPHEAWHVVQQKQGRVKPTAQLKEKVPVNDDPQLEREADVMGTRANFHAIPVFHGAQGLKTGFSGTFPVQRALDNRILKDYSRDKRLVGEVARAMQAYNQGLKSKSEKEKLNELNTIMQMVYRWFDENKGGDLNDHTQGPKMKQVLNDLQAEHIRVVTSSVKKGGDDSDPPVANFDSLPENMQVKVKNIWKDLVNGTGNIVITEKQTYKPKDGGDEEEKRHKGFRFEALAAFARLLESEFGRDLLIRTNRNTGQQKTITIRPGNAMGEDNIPSEEFVAKAQTMDSAELQEVDVKALLGNKKKGSNAWKKVMAPLNKLPVLNIPKDATPEERIQLIHDAPKIFAGKGGYRIKSETGWKYFKFNKGTGSEIVFTRDIKDSTNHFTSRFIDKDGNETIVPVFVTLAHELGHALHFLEGNAVGSVTESLGSIVAPGENFSNWSNLEEFHTIKGVENSVRKDTGMTDRFSHHNFLSYTCQTIRNGPLENAYTAAAQLPRPARNNIERVLNQVNDALGIRNLKQGKKLLKQALQMIDDARQEVQQQQQQQNQQVNNNAPQQTFWEWAFDRWPFK